MLDNTKLDNLPEECKKILVELIYKETPAQSLHDCYQILSTLYGQASSGDRRTTDSYFLLNYLADFFNALAIAQNFKREKEVA